MLWPLRYSDRCVTGFGRSLDRKGGQVYEGDIPSEGDILMGTRYEGDISRILWWTKGTNHVYWCTPRKAIGTCFGAFCCTIVLDQIFCRVLYGPRAVHGFILRTKNQWTKGTNHVYWSAPRKAIGTCFGAFCCMVVLDHIFCGVLYGPRAVHAY